MNIRELEKSLNQSVLDARGPFYESCGGGRFFSSVSAGIQSASHRIFESYTRMIPGHGMPVDFFEKEHPDPPVGKLTVLSLAFHIAPRIVEENSREVFLPARSWFEARHRFDFISGPVGEILRGLFPGIRMVMPVKSVHYRADLSSRTPVSNWSERHVAFACGLGSFGLHGALITRLGCTHRLTSIIIDREIEGGEEPPTDPYFSCPHFADGTCGACVFRCPVGAIAPGKHIIEKCYDHEWLTCRERSVQAYGSTVAACGLCMCGVPCSLDMPG